MSTYCYSLASILLGIFLLAAPKTWAKEEEALGHRHVREMYVPPCGEIYFDYGCTSLECGTLACSQESPSPAEPQGGTRFCNCTKAVDEKKLLSSNCTKLDPPPPATKKPVNPQYATEENCAYNCKELSNPRTGIIYTAQFCYHLFGANVELCVCDPSKETPVQDCDVDFGVFYCQQLGCGASECLQTVKTEAEPAGISFCKCGQEPNPDAAKKLGCARAELKPGETKPTDTTPHKVTAENCAYQCLKLSKVNPGYNYTAQFCDNGIGCFCIPNTKKSTPETGTEMEQESPAAAVAAQVIYKTFQMVVSFVLASVKSVKKLVQSLVSFNLGDLVSGLMGNLQNILDII